MQPIDLKHLIKAYPFPCCSPALECAENYDAL